MYTSLLTQLENGIFTITINRPDKLNALNRTVLTELDAAIAAALANAEVRALILTGAGPKAFVAGADIGEFSGLTPDDAMQLANRGQEIFFRIEQANKPIVAAVNGFALGGGCELAMSCHFRVASDNARFGQPEVNLGLIPGYGGTQRLVQLIGKGKALELLMGGGMLSAAEAEAWGLVNYVTSPDELLARTRQVLEGIITKAPLAVAGCIRAANAVFDERQNGYAVEIEAFGACFATEDMKEGVSAFQEKRKPLFKGR
ncbi:MAG: hypothetical protein RJA57_665 [Bacteroidota bacterium]|jgi:enoyl-CoA hydratase